MKKRTKYTILIITLALFFLPGVAVASNKITINSIAATTPGGTVQITGTSPFSSLSVKVLRPDTTIMYVDSLTADGGNFSITFTLPADAVTGSYTVVVGQGSIVGVETFTVNSSGGSGSSGSSSGGSSSSTKPTETPAEETPEEPAVEGKKLSDISTHWAAANIQRLVNANVINGYPDGTFKPNDNITRAEFAVIIVKALKMDLQSGKVFEDTENHWAKDYIATAAARGIVTGYNDSSFDPDAPITREQMAVMIMKAIGINATDSASAFSDSQSISDWAQQAVEAALQAQIITGYPDNTFRAGANATRAEAVTVIIRAVPSL